MIDSVWEEDFTHQITDDGSGIGAPCTFVDLAGKPNFKFPVSLTALTALPSVGIDTGITIEGDEIQLHRTAGWMNVGGTNYTVTPIRCDVDALRVHPPRAMWLCVTLSMLCTSVPIPVPLLRCACSLRMQHRGLHYLRLQLSGWLSALALVGIAFYLLLSGKHWLRHLLHLSPKSYVPCVAIRC